MRTTTQNLLSTLIAAMRLSRYRSIIPASVFALLVFLAQCASALPIITSVVEIGGDNEATDTIVAKWTGVIYNTTIADEPIIGTPVGTPYTVVPFGNGAPCYVDRAHRYTNADPVALPAYLVGGEYIMNGNDNRDNATMTMDVTVSSPVRVYLLIDNRLGDTSDANPPTFDATHMQWVLDEGWVAVKSGANRTSDATLPDEVAIDEGADGTINNHFSVYTKVFPAGTFQLKQADNTGQNMYGAVVTPGPRVVAPLVWQVGTKDGGWPAGNGGGPNASFVQENGTINALPGVPNSPEVDQQADNDYYFAGVYTTAIPSVTASYGAYAPVGPVAVNEEAAERAFAAADNDLRYHFNLPASLTPLDLFSVSFSAINLDEGHADSRYGIEVYFNGVKVQDQIVIRPPQYNVDYTTPLFSLASVNAQTGPGADNIVSLRGINYNADGGGNWMGIDYVKLNATEGLAPGYLQKVTFNNMGTSVAFADLLSNPRYINDQFDITCLRTDFSANNADECDNCAHVVRGYFIPKVSGPHTFYFCSDDGGGLFLSTDESPAHKALIAVEPVWSARKTYVGEASGGGRVGVPSPSGGPQANISAPINLVAGNRYYIEGAVKEAGGGDNIDVAVQGPGDPAVVNGALGISGDRIAATVDVTGSSLTITQNPALNRVPEGGEASFTVAATATSPLCGGVTLYQWQRKGSSDADYADIAGASSATYTFGPVHPEDNLSSYRCKVRVPGITTTSASASLEVLGRECLRVVSASGIGDFKHVKVLFSTFIDTNDVATTDPFAYTVTGPGGPLSVTGVAVNSDGKSVTLTTDPQAAETAYVVEVTGVKNIVGSLTCDAPNNQATFSLIFAPGFALKEYYQTWTAGGGSVDALVTGPQPPPTISCFVNLWQMNTSDEYDNYGGRISGYFVPVASGPHVFYMASDDYGRLFLSTDENPANKVEICREPVWSGRRTWVGEAGGSGRIGTPSASGGPQANISGAINLVAGQKYYMESWFTEGGGGDNMAVAVQGPGQPAPATDSSPVTTANIGAYITPPAGSSASITLQPIDATALQNSFATFTSAGTASSSLCGPASTYQWFRNGVPIIGATSPTLNFGPATLADNGARFKMRVAAVGIAADSAEAVLTVSSDVSPPVAVAAAAGPAPSNVTINFNELLKQTTAEDIFNYAVLGADPAVSVTGAILKADGSNVVLTLDGNLTAGRSYSVTISFVADLADNQIVPTSLSFNVPTTGGYAAAVLADEPIAYWRFNDAPPTAVNLGSLGAAANGIYNGGAAPGSEALRPPAFPGFDAGNSALQCNGTDAYVGTAISLLNGRPAFTISGWMRRNADQAARTGLWGQNDLVEFGYIANGTLEVWTDNGLDIPNSIPNGEWAHLAIVSEGNPGTMSMYTNGVLAGSRTHSLPPDNAFLFNIGGGGVFDGTGNFFNGQIDEVAVYGKALTAAQIQAQYRSAFTIPGYGFDDGLLPPGTIASGTTAPFVQDGVLHLTDRVNSQVNFWTVPLDGVKNFAKIKASWRMLIDNPGGADGMSFNLGKDVGTGFTPEDGSGSGLTVCVDTYNNGAGDAGLDIKYNGATLTHLAVGNGPDGSGSPPELALGHFVNTSVEVTSSGAVTFQYDTLTITAQIPNYGALIANQYVFAARTGGANENCWIDDVIFTGQELQGPTITAPPADQSVFVGQTATFSVTASGAAPLGYQWSRKLASEPGFSPIGGATAASYTTPPTAYPSEDLAQFKVQVTDANGTVGSGAATLHVVPPGSPLLLWTVGKKDGGWPSGDGGGPNTSFVQENGVTSDLPGSPTSPEIDQQADNDYYFAGSYDTVIAGNGSYTPVGLVPVNEEAAERAFAGDDQLLRYHFNLPSSLLPTDQISVTFSAINLDGSGADPRWGAEVYFNGVKIQDEIIIRTPQLNVDYTTPVFSLASVNAQMGPGADNIVSLRGISYNADTGGNWMGIDYVQLNAIQSIAPTVAITSPADGATIEACSTATICADASGTGGARIVQVAFVANGNIPLGVAAIATNPPPYCVSVPNVPAGAYVLTAIATDSRGNSTTSAPVNVTVADQTPPVVTCPGNISGVRSTSPAGAVVTYTASASDSCGAASVACVPPSGSTFPIGTTTVNCTATDTANNTARCSFTVTVIPGSQPPTAVISTEQLVNLGPEFDYPVLISCNWWNACLIADGYSSSTTPPGGALTYLWNLDTDPVPFAAGPVATNCMEVGVHTIILTVTDPAGLSGSTSKTLEVVTAPLAIELLIEEVNGGSLKSTISRKIKRELTATLRVALGFAGDEKLRETQKALDAFEKKVRAQVAKDHPDEATIWIKWSQAVSEGMEKCIKPPHKGKGHDDDKKDDGHDSKK